MLGGRVPVLEDLAQLPYSRMVVEEALRLLPHLVVLRDAIAADAIGGYHVPAGSSVFLTPYVTHRHPALWANPDAFDPERFTPERVAARPRFAYFPFGGGQRQCIGNHMALVQLQLALIMIAQRTRLPSVAGHPVQHAFLVSMRPVHGIVPTSQRRTPAARRVLRAPSVLAANGAVCPIRALGFVSQAMPLPAPQIDYPADGSVMPVQRVAWRPEPAAPAAALISPGQARRPPVGRARGNGGGVRTRRLNAHEVQRDGIPVVAAR